MLERAWHSADSGWLPLAEPAVEPTKAARDVSPGSPADKNDWRSSLASAESFQLPAKLHADLDNAHEDAMSSPSAPRSLLWALCLSKLLARAASISFTSSHLFDPSTVAFWRWYCDHNETCLHLFSSLQSLC